MNRIFLVLMNTLENLTEYARVDGLNLNHNRVLSNAGMVHSAIGNAED
jgi:hypothetical protein